MDPLDFDPLGGSDPLSFLGRGSARRRKAAFPSLPPEQEKPLTDRLLEGGQSLLHSLGGTLDKAFGARAIRGYLGGNNRELLSAIPFSDTLGFTRPEDSVSMDDLLVKHGFVNPNNPNAWEARDFLVPVAEALADPGTYLSFGAKTLAGQTASKLGKLPKGLAAGMRGFDLTEDALRAAGHSAGEISHISKSGVNVADEATSAAIRQATGRSAESQPLRSLIGIGLPFKEPSFTIGSGPLAQRIGGNVDVIGNAIKTAPGVRHLRSLFDASTGGSSNPLAASAFADAARPVQDAVQSETRGLEYGLRDRFSNASQSISSVKGGEREALNLLRSAAVNAPEGIDPGEFIRTSNDRFARGVAPGIDDAQNLRDVQAGLLGSFNQFQNIGSDIRGIGSDLLERSRQLGLNQSDLGDEFIDYVPRRSVSSKAGVQAGGDIFSTRNGSNISRKDVLRDIPGGDVQINTWVMDPRLVGPNRLPDTDRINIVLNDMMSNLAGGGVQMTPDLTARITAKADDVLGLLSNTSDYHALEHVPYFHPNIFEDVTLRGNRAAKAMGSAEAAYDAINKAAQPIGSLKQGVTVKDLLGQMGLVNHRIYDQLDQATEDILRNLNLTPDQARDLISKAARGDAAAKQAVSQIPQEALDLLSKFKLQGSYPKAYEALAKHVPYLGDITNENMDQVAKVLASYGIEATDADAMTKYFRSWLSPTEVEPFVKGFDSIQNLFKAWSYSSWPASHVRNLVSALYNNWIHGANFDDARAAFQLMREGKLDPSMFGTYRLPAASSAEQAAKDLIGRAYAHGKVFTGHNGANDLLGTGVGPRIPDQIVPDLPGTGIAGQTGSFLGDSLDLLKQTGQGLLTKEGLNPLNVSGVAGRTSDGNALVKTGRMIGSNIENFARLQSYLSAIRNGATDQTAGALTRKIHFDYGDLTPFEKNVMRRLVPFYTFTRKNLPFQVEQLLTKPSNVGIPLKAFNAAKGDAYVPEYLQSGLSLPIGDEQDGTQRFLSSIGLPFEEAFGHIKMQNGLPNINKTAMNYLGTLNPLLKGPLEQIFDRQFHTGRKLSDLRPTGVGSAFGALDEDSSQLLAQVLANTPATRFVSTIDKLIDDRKGPIPKALNLLTGTKISDVNMDRIRAIDAREVLNDMLSGNDKLSEFTNYYVKPENRDRLNQEDILMLQLFAAYKEKAKQAAERERMKIGVKP